MKSLKMNAVLNMIKTCSRIIFPLITFPYISRVLMPENIGKINFGSAYVSYFALLAGLGISTYAIRECAKVREDRDKINDIASQIYSINIITTAIAYAFLFISLYCFQELEYYRELIMIQCTVILFTTLGADWINTAFEDFAYITIRTVVFQVISLILMFAFVREADDYLVYACIVVLSGCGSNIVNIIYRRRFCNLSFTISIEWKKHLAPIGWLFGLMLSQTILTSADVTMLGVYVSDYAVGIYTTAAKIANIINQLVASLLFVLLPRLSYMFAESDYSKINPFLNRVLEYFLLLGIPIAISVILFADDYIIVLAGDAFLDSVLVLKVLMISFLCSLIGGSFLGNMVLLSSGREKLFTIILIVITFIDVVVNYWVIPIYGAVGAASSTALVSFIMLVLLILTKDKRIEMNGIFRMMIYPCIASAIFALYGGWCRNIEDVFFRAVIETLGSGLIYIVILNCFGNSIIKEVIISVKKKVNRI